jgi:hypothetical protein
MVVTVPPSPGGTVQLRVTRAGETSAPLSYSFGTPSISQLTPASAPTAGGVQLTVTGNNFGDTTQTTVSVGGRICSGVAGGHTTVRCTLPAGEGVNQPVVVNVAGNTTSSTLSYTAPTLTGVTPSTLPAGGGTLTLSGNNFGLTPVVTIGAAACPVTQSGHSLVLCTAPAGAGQQAVRLNAAGQLSNTLTVAYDSGAGGGWWRHCDGRR